MNVVKDYSNPDAECTDNVIPADRTEVRRRNMPTAVTGPDVVPGDYSDLHNQYGLLRTIEDEFGLPYVNNAATADPINLIWS